MTDITLKIKTTYSPEINTITVKSDSKVLDIMKEIEKYSKVPPEGQKLIFKGKILKSEEPISTYGLENDCTLIMVKSVKTTSSAEPSAPSTVPTNNVSSNPEENITVKVKTTLNNTIHSVPINKNATVLGLKAEIEKATSVPTAQQKLVIKGKTMKDTDNLSTYNLTNDSVIAMLRTGGSAGGLPNLGGMPDMSQLGQMMNNPQYQQGLNALLNNPAALNQLLNSPQLRPLLEANPQVREMLQNPQMRQLLLNPQLMQRMMGQMGQMGQQGFSNPFAGGMDLGGLDNQSPNTRLGDLFSQWMEEQRTGGSSQGGHSEPQPVPSSGTGAGSAQRPQAVYQQIPQPDPNVDYKTLYKDQIAQIKEMGIDDEEKIIDALKKCDGNVQYALNRLFG